MQKLITNDDVKRFMVACDQTEFGYDTDQYKLYCNLVEEEYNEILDADDNLVEIIDGIIDSIWVLEGLKNTISDDNKFSYSLQEIVDFNEKLSEDTIDTLIFLMYEGYDQFKSDPTIESIDFFIDSLYRYGCYLTDIETIQECWNEVARSNMSKISESGKVLKNEYGKVQKPDTYSPPDIQRILMKNGYFY